MRGAESGLGRPHCAAATSMFPRHVTRALKFSVHTRVWAKRVSQGAEGWFYRWSWASKVGKEVGETYRRHISECVVWGEVTEVGPSTFSVYWRPKVTLLAFNFLKPLFHLVNSGFEASRRGLGFRAPTRGD
jgi:hypothetical protein